MILQITKLISELLKKIDNEQEAFNKDRKHKDKLKGQESIEKYTVRVSLSQRQNMPGKSFPEKGK